MSVDSNLSLSREFTGQPVSSAPRTRSMLAAFVAIVAVYFFRMDHSAAPLKLFFETLVFACLPLVAFFIVRRRFSLGSLATITNSILVRFQLGAVLIGVIVVAWHVVCRQLGIGSAYEVIALLTIQNIGWYLAVFSKVPGFERTSFVLCGFTAFFVCCVTDQFEVFAIAGAYAFVSLWWLLGQYWNRLETKTIDGKTRSLPVHGGAISVTTIVVGGAVCLAAAIPFSQNRVSLSGFMPFSGGENGYDDLFARSGIGDGNMLAIGNNATTTGAVDSTQVIEGHKKSLYDAVSEQYNGPITKPQGRRKAISMSSIAKHLDAAKQSEQSGKTFRTIRNSDKEIKRDYEDRITEALFFVEGSAPARFATNTFDHFDGWDWSRKTTVSTKHLPPSFDIDKRSGPDVFCVDQRQADYLTDNRWHCVKIMRLKSEVIPAPAFLQRWRIPQVDRPDMFRWNEAGLLCLDGDSVPAQTMVFLQSFVPNYHLLRDVGEQIPQGEDHKFLQVPQDAAQAKMKIKVEEWTANVRPGWEQVEAIVGHMRSDFELNPSWKINKEADSSVDEFLRQGGGPSYMFATTCAMALRSIGFETRLVNGFLVRKSDYDFRANQSMVTSGNLHTWPEVCLDGKFWIPVEPTPGCPIPYNTQTAWQWLSAQVRMAVAWIFSHPVTTVISMLSICLCVAFRARLVTALLLAWWMLVRLFWPQGLLKATRQLIDLRFWFAGDRRPGWVTVPAWYGRVDAHQTERFFDLWNAKNYSDVAQEPAMEELVSSCWSSVSSLTLTRIRSFAINAKKENA